MTRLRLAAFVAATAFVAVALKPIARASEVGASGGLVAAQEDPFPHAPHQGLFPVCTGCHAGIADGDEVTAYPAASQCSGCHDGVDQDRVDWRGPSRRPSNVVFDHATHTEALATAGDDVVSCESCHSDPGAGRMAVDDTEELGACWACHAHARTEHFESVSEGASGDCTSCHVPLARSGFGRARIEALPAPPAHEGDTYLLDGHAAEVVADVARCATCHTRDRCAACHVDASLEPIQALPAAPADMELPPHTASYPTPATHEERGFAFDHARLSDRSTCATCHTSDDCSSCHVPPAPEAVTTLPARSDTPAPGVGLRAEAPETHASVFFIDAHANLAAAEPSTCATCHTETDCADCHDGPPDGGYHAPGYSASHAAEAFGQAQECATCHNTAAFCRACHVEVGFGSTGRLGGAYHDAEPLFLLRHGQAARQSLEGCVSCHRQNDCVQCHGVLGAFQVSPHTAAFDAPAAWARNPRTCLACHIGNPLGGAP